MKKNNFSQKEIDDFYKNVGKKVKNLRIKNKISQLDLSYAMGYKSVSLISAAELYTNKKHFNLEHIYKICKIFDIDANEILEIS